MGKAELMQEEISNQRKLPEDIKEKLNKITFINFCISIFLMICLLAMNISFLKLNLKIFTSIAKIFAMVVIITDVIIFEIGYRKDKISFWIHGFEVLLYGVLVLIIPYIYSYSNNNIKSIAMLTPIYIAIYYVGKAIIIHYVEIKKHQHNLSDVKEIIKEGE